MSSNLYLINIGNINGNTFCKGLFVRAVYAILTTMFFNLGVRQPRYYAAFLVAKTRITQVPGWYFQGAIAC
ncbi:hypothetical protein AGR1B_Lc50340 [Agrobacterium fabacearum S56]|nr:hypothetical protein AGR1B_Lc50340 [Agrobacterium fabacearum S56]